MATTYLITEAEIKEICTAIDQNIDPSFLNLYILAVQSNYVRPLLGKDLYNQIMTQAASNTLSTDNRTLVDLMKRPIAFWVWAESVWELTYRTTNAGVVASADDKFIVAEPHVIDAQMERYKNYAENWWNNDVKEYLCDNPSLYPLYASNIKNAFNSGYGLYF